MKVNNQNKWGNDGTHYNQTITINQKTAVLFNNYIEKILNEDKKEIEAKRIMTNEQAKREIYLKRLSLGANYLYLTTLFYFMLFLGRHTNENIKRIKNRNTIIIVK